MTIIQDINNQKVFGVNLGIPSKSTSGSDFSEKRKDSGYIFSNNKIEEFTLPELTEINNQLTLFSKDLEIEAKLLSEVKLTTQIIVDIVNLFKTLKDKGIKLPLFSKDLLAIKENGDIILFPPSIIEFLNNRQSLNQKLESVSKIRFPELEGEKSLLFSFGILLYQLTTNEYPYDFKDVEDLRDKMRRKKIILPRWRNILISDETNNLIINLLETESEITIDTAVIEINKLIENGLYREENNFEKEINRNNILHANQDKIENSRYFIKKHRGLIIGSTLVIIVVGTMLGNIIYNKMKPPQTVGFSSEQVVESYFQSIQTLDTELLDDVLQKGVRKSDSNEISTLYVTSKMRQQTDPSARFYLPKEWLLLDDDKKAITDVFGIYNLEIEQISENKFRTTYEKWYTHSNNDDPNAEFVRLFTKYVKEEIFTLEETKFSFKIINIETIKEVSEKAW